MQYLIDTHVFLWFVGNAKGLSKTAKPLIEDGQNEIFISIASLWEISIKTALGKLAINGNYESVIDDVNDNSIKILPINFAHTVEQNRLPFHHRDPFDRVELRFSLSLLELRQLFKKHSPAAIKFVVFWKTHIDAFIKFNQAVDTRCYSAIPQIRWLWRLAPNLLCIDRL